MNIFENRPVIGIGREDDETASRQAADSVQSPESATGHGFRCRHDHHPHNHRAAPGTSRAACYRHQAPVALRATACRAAAQPPQPSTCINVHADVARGCVGSQASGERRAYVGVPTARQKDGRRSHTLLHLLVGAMQDAVQQARHGEDAADDAADARQEL